MWIPPRCCRLEAEEGGGEEEGAGEGASAACKGAVDEEEEEADASYLLSLSSRPRSSSTAAVACSQCWFSWLRSSSRCVPFGCRQARGQVDMDQKYYYAVCVFYWSRCSSRCALVLCRQGHDARHHGRYDSEGQVPRGVPQNWVLLGDDVTCFRIQLVGSTVDTDLCRLRGLVFGSELQKSAATLRSAPPPPPTHQPPPTHNNPNPLSSSPPSLLPTHNNNTIWRGSVLTGEEPPPHSG